MLITGYIIGDLALFAVFIMFVMMPVYRGIGLWFEIKEQRNREYDQ
jgi:hypothetical protein